MAKASVVVRAAAAPETLESRAIKSVADYRHWTPTTKEAHLVYSWLDITCAGPTPRMVQEDADNPHKHKYVIVYVNDVGKSAMMKQVTPHFPVGSVVVKEKRLKPKSGSAELCTVMLKREAGYNPTGGDWEYFVTDGTGKHVVERGLIARCISCHAQRKDVDYVFRYGLPDLELRRLHTPGH